VDEQEEHLNREGREQWERKAAFWDELHGERGNLFHRRLVGPAVERLLALQPGERVLDVACGNGVMARRLAELGGKITGTDFSPALIERAQGRNVGWDEPVKYLVVDATDEEALAALGEGQFDALISTMALMDMPVIAPLFRAAHRLLRPGGRVVFATSHPAFNSNSPTFVAELADVDGELVTTHALKIGAYIESFSKKGVGAPNEPAPHYYYHRPLQLLLGEAFAAGFVLDALEEPAFTSQEAVDASELSWGKVWQLPPVLAGRLRRRL
jgi:ubiquinone/menaquinone biosynthesis C-methylase UbiE